VIVAERDAEATARIQADIEAIVARAGSDATIPAADAAALMTRHAIASAVELAFLALPIADAMARPPISGFRVAAVGIEGESGDLLLGANLEFPQSDLTTTIHAEGFVALRARRRGRPLATLAVREARPCAHCRQTLAEAASADGLRLVDPQGNDRSLDDLYPLSFRPAALGEEGDVPGRIAWPNLAYVAAPPAEVAAKLLEAGARAHAPYSSAPSAVALRATDGRILTAGCVESVAFNPSISALQAALVEVVAAGIDTAHVEAGWLGATEGGSIDPEPGFRALLHAVAPGASAAVARWRPGPAR
jgi:cytidine deaminase